MSNSFCAVPVNKTAMLIIGGYSQKGALDSVELLDTETGRWEQVEKLPKPRYTSVDDIWSMELYYPTILLYYPLNAILTNQ